MDDLQRSLARGGPQIPQSDIDALVAHMLGVPPAAQAPFSGPMLPAPAQEQLVAPVVPAQQPAAQAAAQGAQGGGPSPAMLAQLAGQVPQLGAQIGRLFDTVSDRRQKAGVVGASDDIEAFLDAMLRF